MKAIVLTFAFCLLPSAFALAQVAQRDAPAQGVATGTAAITGQVMADDTPPRPVSRAIVDCANSDGTLTRSAVTDGDGRFAFSSLPAGRYTISAHKAAYLTVAYGAARSGRPGTPISVVRDQQVTISMRMPRGAVMTGVVRTREGRPAADVRISAVSTRAADRNSGMPSSALSATTDDTGTYRLYGVMPGEYTISGQERVTGNGEIGARSEAELDAVLAQIALRNSAASNLATPPPNAPRPARLPPAPAMGFAPTYFPGTPVASDAAPITVAAGEERTGLDFQIAPVRAATIGGTVSGPLPNVAVTQLSILPGAPGWFTSAASNPILSARPTEGDGAFKYTNVTPGHYTITARADRQKTTPDSATDPRGMLLGNAGGAGPAGPIGPSGDLLYAVAEVDVSGEDVGGIDLALQPGSVVSGRLVFDGATATPPGDLSAVHLNLALPGQTFSMNMGGTMVGTQLSSGAAGQMGADGSFVISNVGPGTYVLRPQLPASLSQTWSLRSASAGDRDYLDVPLEISAGRNPANLVVTLSDRHTELSGVLQTQAGAPAADFFVVAFSTDRSTWRANARRTQSTRPSSDGRFAFRDLPPGDYFLAALTDVEPADLGDAKFLEQLVPASIKLTLAEGEKKTQDITIAGR